MTLPNAKIVLEKMKTLSDRQTERRTFLPGDQILVLLPFTGSPFKARYSGPHTVMEKLSDQNQLINRIEIMVGGGLVIPPLKLMY